MQKHSKYSGSFSAPWARLSKAFHRAGLVAYRLKPPFSVCGKHYCSKHLQLHSHRRSSASQASGPLSDKCHAGSAAKALANMVPAFPRVPSELLWRSHGGTRVGCSVLPGARWRQHRVRPHSSNGHLLTTRCLAKDG
jgi:hypothetical protein